MERQGKIDCRADVRWHSHSLETRRSDNAEIVSPAHQSLWNRERSERKELSLGVDEFVAALLKNMDGFDEVLFHEKDIHARETGDTTERDICFCKEF